jgi:hypothetical protein
MKFHREACADEPRTGFARRQLDQMCEDRPDMFGVLAQDDFVYKWIEQCLDINDIESRVYWIPLEPEAGLEAQNCPKNSRCFSQVRITSDLRLSGEDRWILLIFELHNIDSGQDFYKLGKSLWLGSITVEQYADECMLLELAAEVRTKHFCVAMCLPLIG